MPVYEYRCPTCGHEFEKLAKVGDPNPKCPQGCDNFTVKLLSRTSFVLEGGGWAADSYGGGSMKK
jgi:putative FmdB family regulatory protein